MNVDMTTITAMSVQSFVHPTAEVSARAKIGQGCKIWRQAHVREDAVIDDGFIIGASPLGRLKGSAARWTPDMEHDWVPLRQDRVVEVAVDQVDGDRPDHVDGRDGRRGDGGDPSRGVERHNGMMR